ncbi:hypothetical protein PMI14_00297 [Acidovorax sp. CF316]|uniref:hypothetical protein n=1 Tax=Acidovorax sp. CF316 TaxID=1144317 RepID=UPI00026BE9C4|nr:hypothetical protein [Acidovorax sp. CF316]EJE54805.1 hypothetical protein PMI14_00297 [Acidovorax sp. CF316]
MKSLILTSALMLVAPGLALAQSAAEPAKKSAPAAKKEAAPKKDTAAAKPAAKPAAKTAEAKEKTPPKKTAKAEPTSSRQQLNTAANQVASGLIAADAALSPEEQAIAQKVHTGRIACELGAFVNVTADPAIPGRFHIEGKGFKYHMTPVVTSTGAVRLEDQKGGAVWLQIANKSMLMNQKLGQRLADECMSAEQTLVAEAAKKAPPQSVFDPAPAATATATTTK